MQYSASVSPEYLQLFDKTYKFSSHHLTITQKEIPVSEPSVITEALRQIGQRCKGSPRIPVLSDITNCLDVPSSAEHASEAKRLCRRETPQSTQIVVVTSNQNIDSKNNREARAH